MTLLTLMALTTFLPQAADLEQQIARRPTAAGYRALASAYERMGEFSKASKAFESASVRYGKLGDPNAAKVLHQQAERYRSNVQIFVDVPAPIESRRAHYLARLEPATGCYVGANIEREDGGRAPEEFDRAIGKNQAVFFLYRRYGMPFPVEQAREFKQSGAGIQIAFEPGNLDEVQADDYLRGFAREAARSRIPIFLRFASEMNGDWTPYHSNTYKYIEKFRLVADVMHREAPNVAMVWCPNEIPEQSIPSYFPGDDAVDWVGVNFYSVIYNDGDRARGAEWRNPADALEYVYQRYAASHPIMIGEWGASHRSVVDEVDRSDFAIDKIGQLYAALPRRYPRVKAVHWLSMDTEKYAEGERKLNDFSLLDSPDVAMAYSRAIAPDYFLSSVKLDGGDPPQNVPAPLGPQTLLRGVVRLSVLLRSYDRRPKVSYTVGGTKTFDGGLLPGPYDVAIDTRQFTNGPASLQVTVADSEGRIGAKQVVTVQIRN